MIGSLSELLKAYGLPFRQVGNVNRGGAGDVSTYDGENFDAVEGTHHLPTTR
jgi:hypothetical protein